jgi:hypothetical protein
MREDYDCASSHSANEEVKPCRTTFTLIISEFYADSAGWPTSSSRRTSLALRVSN